MTPPLGVGRLRATPTKKRSLYLRDAIYTKARKAAQRDPLCRGNWSMWVEEAIREKLERDGAP